MPDSSKAKASTAQIFALLDSEDEDQLQTRQKSRMLKSEIVGQITFTKVDFNY